MICENLYSLKKHFIGILCSLGDYDEYDINTYLIKCWINGEVILYTIDINEFLSNISDEILNKVQFLDEVVVSFDASVNVYNRLADFESVEVYEPVDVY